MSNGVLKGNDTRVNWHYSSIIKLSRLLGLQMSKHNGERLICTYCNMTFENTRMSLGKNGGSVIKEYARDKL